jgi:hypothetical protein
MSMPNNTLCVNSLMDLKVHFKEIEFPCKKFIELLTQISAL